MSKENLTGKVYGRLTVIQQGERHHHANGSYSRWWCQCVCGSEPILVLGPNLKYGGTQSCGCLNKEASSKKHTKHGMTKSREHVAWGNMKSRCTNPKNPGYRDYGGRGITISDEWLNSFENFYRDMGPRPSKHHSIERIDVNGNYNKENCKWATTGEQCNNKRNTLYFEHNGVRKPLAEITRELGLNYSVIAERIKRGSTFEEAISVKGLKVVKVSYEYDGQTKLLIDWCREFKLSYTTIRSRLEEGMLFEVAISIDRLVRKGSIRGKNGVRTIEEACEENNITFTTFVKRLYDGMTIKEALRHKD